MSKNSIKLTKEQREELEQLISKGTVQARKIQHAQVLLKIDSGEGGPNWSDQQVKEAFAASILTIWRIRQRFLEQGFSSALNRRPQPERPEKQFAKRALVWLHKGVLCSATGCGGSTCST